MTLDFQAQIESYVVPPPSDDLGQEILDIGAEYVLGGLVQDRAIARWARNIIEGRIIGKKIADQVNGGEITFAHQEEFVEYLETLYGVSRSSFMESLSQYRRLIGIGLTWDNAFRAVSKCPIALRALTEVVKFDEHGSIVGVDSRKAKALPVPDKDAYMKEIDDAVAVGDKQTLIDTVRKPLESFVDELASQPNGKEAAKYANAILGRNTVSFTVNGGLLAHCVERVIDDNGEITEFRFDVQLKAERVDKKEIPEWFYDRLCRRLNASHR